ncbi:MAG: rhomboid family intramembrane serine protease [Myxococcales bacterium]|nr:rhomboid family intramembrane serine protease [Myxococcales bacterium]
MLLRVQRADGERRITVDELEEGIVTGDVLAEMPLQVDGRWRRAAEWPAWDALVSSSRAGLFRIWRRAAVPWVTACTLGLLVHVHVVSLALSRHGIIWPLEALTRESSGLLERGEWWRLLTYGLLHSNVGHLLSNGAGLLLAGLGLERLVGPRATLLILVVSTGLGGAASGILLTDVPSIGISGGVFGMLGASVVLGLRYRDSIPPGSRAVFGGTTFPFVVYALYTGTQSQGVDNWCHLGGFVGGIATGALLRADIPHWRRWNLGVGSALGVFLAALLSVPVAIGPALLPWTPWEADGATTLRPSWWSVQVGRSGLSGYGNPDRSTTVALDTERRAFLATSDALFQEELAELQHLDPQAIMTAVSPDEVRYHYTVDGTDRELLLRVFLRGLYVTSAGVDATAGAPLGPLLRQRVVDGLVLTVPKDLEDDLAGEHSRWWKAQLQAAVARAALGQVEQARPGFAAARAAGNAREVALAELRVLAALRHPDAEPAMIRALAEWPGDSTVARAAASARAELGLPTPLPPEPPAR